MTKEAEDAIVRELVKQTSLLRELVAQVERITVASENQASHTGAIADAAEEEATAAAWERYHAGTGPKPK